MIRLSKDEKVICDGHFTIEQAEAITDISRIVFMLKEPVNLVDEYCNRVDHLDFSEYIHSASDFDNAKKICNETLFRYNEKRYYDIKNSDYFYIEREEGKSLDEVVDIVARYFNIDK